MERSKAARSWILVCALACTMIVGSSTTSWAGDGCPAGYVGIQGWWDPSALSACWNLCAIEAGYVCDTWPYEDCELNWSFGTISNNECICQFDCNPS